MCDGSPFELGRSMVAERYGHSSRPTLDEAPLPDGELSHLLTRNPVLDDLSSFDLRGNKKLSYCWETVRRESMPRIAEMDVEMTT